MVNKRYDMKIRMLNSGSLALSLYDLHEEDYMIHNLVIPKVSSDGFIAELERASAEYRQVELLNNESEDG